MCTQDGSKENKHYYYTKGWNIQALIAYLAGIALPFPGFVGTLGANVSVAADQMGHLGWLLSFSVSFTVYYVLCKVWPTQNQKRVREMDLKWEEMGSKELVAADGTLIESRFEGYPDPDLDLDGRGEKWGGVDLEEEDRTMRK